MADSWFDLDVAGAIRGQYLVGRHAIQLPSAVGVWHFDGAAPCTTWISWVHLSHMPVLRLLSQMASTVQVVWKGVGFCDSDDELADESIV